LDYKKEKQIGGWSATEITQEVEEAVDFLVSRMNNASLLKEILSAKRQVVKGYILPSGTRGEILTNLFFVACKAKSAAVAGATASIFNAAGRKKKATKITSCARGEYNYKVTSRLENSSVWAAKVNRGLDGEYTLLQEAKKQ